MFVALDGRGHEMEYKNVQIKRMAQAQWPRKRRDREKKETALAVVLSTFVEVG